MYNMDRYLLVEDQNLKDMVSQGKKTSGEVRGEVKSTPSNYSFMSEFYVERCKIWAMFISVDPPVL
jgi:hypothetical protein